jgi:hypothetical protein
LSSLNRFTGGRSGQLAGHGRAGVSPIELSVFAIGITAQNWTIFAIDTCALRCYKPLKEKLFGGESPIELLTSNTRVRPQTCLAGQAC